jgi:putative addiction module component (TIGR02574 family)
MGDPARVLEDALRLPVHERARVARALIESLDGADADADEGWRAEIRKRIDDVEGGAVQLEDASAVHARIRSAIKTP